MSRSVLVRVLVVLATFALVGAIAGVVWEWLWTPPLGIVYRGQWILEPSGPDYEFSGTGWYVVVALAAGLLTVLAGWLMFTVGHSLGPPDPRPLAAAKDDLERLPSDLRVAVKDPGSSGLLARTGGSDGGGDSAHATYSMTSSASLSFPLGTTVGLALVWFTTGGRRVRRVEEPADR
jgi:hypothetical protein